MAKRLPAFRVPKGVPADVRRALRLKKPGQFLSAEKAFQLADLLYAQEAQLVKAHAKQLAAMERARRPATRAKYVEAVQGTQQRYAGLRHALDTLATSQGVDPLPPLASKKAVPVAIVQAPGVDAIQEDEAAAEWEVGVDYTQQAGYEHAKGPSSDVSFNARIYRDDGRRMTAQYVRDAMELFANRGYFPSHVQLRSISWANSRGQRSSSRDEDDLWSFRDILRAVGDAGWRLGAVKR